MTVVWRFPLNAEAPEAPEHDEEHGEGEAPSERSQRLGYSADVEMPIGAELLPHPKMTSRGVTIYAIVDPEAETETRSFFVVGNGIDLPDQVGSLNYRGLVKQCGGLTAHVFELAKVPA